MFKKSIILFSLCLTVLFLYPLPFAVGDTEVEKKTEAGQRIEAGKKKSVTCKACHGAKGISSNPLWPNLAGQKDKYLIKQLKDFRSGKRSDPSMAPLAKPLTDDDIENLAAYYSSL